MCEILWKISPKHTKNIPGILPLCIGMLVMIKHNEATELSVTNGQEANVVGWTSDTDDDDRNYLQTLFVKLISPIPACSACKCCAYHKIYLDYTCYIS